MKTDLFLSHGHCSVFHICWHTECSTFTALSFRIWNSSTGISLPPLALFVVILPKAHLRMSGSKWMITPSWLSGSWRSFLYSSSVYSCHPFLICSAFVRFIPFLSFIVLIFAWNVPFVCLLFLKRSLVFPVLLVSSISLHDHWGRLSYLSFLFRFRMFAPNTHTKKSQARLFLLLGSHMSVHLKCTPHWSVPLILIMVKVQLQHVITLFSVDLHKNEAVLYMKSWR